jgi:hypothetical protein
VQGMLLTEVTVRKTAEEIASEEITAKETFRN